MTDLERVKATLDHKSPDKLPASIGTTIVDGMTIYAKNRYEVYKGVEHTEDVFTHLAMRTVMTPAWICDRIGTEFGSVNMTGPFMDTTEFEADGSYYDEFGIYWKKSEMYIDPVCGPIKHLDEYTDTDVKKCPWPSAYDKGRVQGIRDKALALKAQGKAVVANIMCGGPFEQSCWTRGMENFLCDMYVNPKGAEALLDRITQSAIEFWDVYLTEIGDLATVVCQGDDVGMQDRAFMSREMYDKFIFKYHKRLFSFIKSKTNAKIFLHSCGSVYELLPGLIEAGVEILNPIQVTAKNMNIERLKSDFGSELVFWGGIDVQRLLPFGKPQQIKDEVHRVCDMFACGGYVLAPSHNLQNYVPEENIDALITAMAER